jgi:hypothetical protein
LALDRSADRARVRELAGARLTALEAQQQELERSRVSLQRLLRTGQSSDAGPCPIIEAFNPERVVLVAGRPDGAISGGREHRAPNSSRSREPSLTSGYRRNK